MGNTGQMWSGSCCSLKCIPICSGLVGWNGIVTDESEEEINPH